MFGSNWVKLMIFPPNRCNCDEGLCGPECKLENPCISNQVCMNDGICIENCDEEPDYICNCTSEYMGKNCTLMVSERNEICYEVDFTWSLEYISLMQGVDQSVQSEIKTGQYSVNGLEQSLIFRNKFCKIL